MHLLGFGWTKHKSTSVFTSSDWYYMWVIGPLLFHYTQIDDVDRGSYMSARVLSNLLNEKRDKMRGLPTILSRFRNKFNTFNNTRARLLDSIYHMTLRILLNLNSGVKNVIVLSLCTRHCYGRYNVSHKSVNSGLSILLHGVISLPGTTSYDNSFSL